MSRNPGLVREHFTAAGKPKRAYRNKQEVRQAPEHTASHRPYRCPVCGWWHRGRRKAR